MAPARVEALVHGADAAVERIGLFEVPAHLRGAGRAEDAVRRRPAEDPRGQEEIGQADDMIGVEMGEEHGIEPREQRPLPDLEKPLGAAAPGVDQQRARIGLDQDRRPVAIRRRPGVAGAEQRDLERAAGLGGERGGRQQRSLAMTRSNRDAEHGAGMARDRNQANRGRQADATIEPMRLRQLNIGCFGGGTGLPSLLGGLKRNPWLRLNAVVTTFDSGGSSGQLRDELGVLPPGDVLRCALALARNEGEARRVLLSRLPTFSSTRSSAATPAATCCCR